MTNYVKQPTFLIYDYETFGRNPALDRPAQFASIRVNSNFEPIEKPAMFFCCPADDYLPEPEAVLITGITPLLAPANTLRSEDAVRLGINRQHCLDNLLLLRSQSDLHKKVLNLYANSEPSITSDNVDAQLHDDLFNNVNRATMDMVRSTSPKNLSALDVSFIDRRLKLLLLRYRARNFANTLNYYEQQSWLEYRRALFTKTRLEDYVQRLELLYHVHEGNEYKIRLIFMLLEYLKQL